MQDPRDNRIHTDINGDSWLTDENGRLLKDESGNNIPPTQSREIENESGFTTYDSSQGHCSFCGKLTCSGSCFK